MAELCRSNVGNAGYGDYILGINYSVQRQDTAGNYSTIYAEVWIYCPAWISFDRSSYSVSGSASGSGSLGTRLETGTHTIWSQTFNVYHDTNGRATLSLNASVSTSFYINGSTGGSVSLPDIKREASLTSNADVVLEGKNSKQSLTFNNPGNFPLQLEYIWDGKTQITKKIGACKNYVVTFTQDEYIRLSKQTSYTLRTVTYTNTSYNSKVGSKDKTGKITCKGRANIYKNGYKKAIPFIYKNGKWNLATFNIYKSGWKIGG